MAQHAVTLKPDQPFDFSNRLTLLVTEHAERPVAPERPPMPRARVLLITRHRQQFIELSAHAPRARWQQYEFWYLGGRRPEVRMSIRSPDGAIRSR